MLKVFVRFLETCIALMLYELSQTHQICFEHILLPQQFHLTSFPAMKQVFHKLVLYHKKKIYWKQIWWSRWPCYWFSSANPTLGKSGVPICSDLSAEKCTVPLSCRNYICSVCFARIFMKTPSSDPRFYLQAPVLIWFLDIFCMPDFPFHYGQIILNHPVCDCTLKMGIFFMALWNNDILDIEQFFYILIYSIYICYPYLYTLKISTYRDGKLCAGIIF